RAELDPRDVAEPEHGAVGVCAENDLAELLRRFEPTLRADGVRELLAVRRRFAADLPTWIHRVLRADRVGDLRDREAELREKIRVHPAAQRVLAAEHLHASHARHARER